jgi:23S rRNA (uracil1939-C5)-methyltransferase
LRAAVADYGALAASSVAETQPAAPIVGYRLRAKLVVHGRALGLYAEGSHEVVDIPECAVLTPRVAKVVGRVRAALPLAIPLLALDVRDADDGVLVTLIAPRGTSTGAARSAAQALMASAPEILGVALAEREPDSPQVLGGAPKPLLGASFAPQHFADDAPWHRAVPGGFVQSHRGQTAALHAAIEVALKRELGALPGRRILELYAGEGALALRLAARGATVTVADSFAPNLAELERSAAAQELHVTTLAANAEHALGGVETPDAIVVDPPRRGLSVEVRAALGRLLPKALVYVSCHPQTLARDLAHLRELGFALDSITPWDMIPLSNAVETLAVLRPGSPPSLRVFYEDDALIVLDKPAHLPLSVRQGSRNLLDAVRQLANASDAVALDAPDADASGLCLFARSARHAVKLSTELANVKRAYLVMARGIVHKRGRIVRPLAKAGAPRPAITRYEREAVVGTHSLVRAFPERERRHQLLIHFAGLGHPVLGDARYGDRATNRFFEERHGLDRAFLHCAELELVRGTETITLKSPLAPDLNAVLAALGGERRKKTPPFGE